MTNLTSDEINYLIYRYLTESGFSHSSFSFANESGILKSDIKGSQVGPGSLIRILQKGLLYMSLEAHVSPQGNIVKCLAPFTLLGTHECQIYPDPSEILANQGVDEEEFQESFHIQDKKTLDGQVFDSPSSAFISSACVPLVPATLENTVMANTGMANTVLENNTSALQEDGKDSMDMDSPIIIQEKSDWVSYHGHSAEVFTCAWNRNDEWIATGYFYFISRFRSGDGTARIWSINDSKAPPIVLQHASDSDTKDVTTLDWHPTGQVLATGSYDGIARIWTIQGKTLLIQN